MRVGLASVALCCSALGPVACAGGANSDDAITDAAEQTPEEADVEAFDSGDTEESVDEACAATSAALESQPMDIVLVLDRSQSMASKWMDMVQSLSTFLYADEATDLHIGVSFFPHLGQEQACDPAAYADLAVPLAPLPTHAASVVSALNAVTTDGATPTYGALSGTYDYVLEHKQQHPERPLIVVFASDGDPCCQICDVEDVGPIAELAGEAAKAGVPTYVVAIEGSSVDSLDAVAAAGGTTQAYDITDDVSAFASTLQEIRSALACDYAIPTPDVGEVLDLEKVNVVYTPGGGAEQTIPKQAGGVDACDGSPAWYYTAEDTIALCPTTCATVREDAYASVSVQFGCETHIK